MPRTNKGTQCVHAGKCSAHDARGVTSPIYTSTSFAYPNEQDEVYYPRYFNVPTQVAVADKIRQLEHGEQGLVFSSGMAAITSTLLGLLKQGDHAIFHDSIYGGTHSFVTTALGNFGIEYTIVTSQRVEDFREQIKPNTRLIFFESPTNPLLSIIDVAEMATMAKAAGVLTVVDNTFATPINQNPLDLGSDVVIHSGTKYLNGHSDVNCGAVASSRQLLERIRQCATSLGGTLDVRGCYLLERGLKTLEIRVQRQCENALQLANALRRIPAVGKVYYPGLPEHGGHDVAAKQMAAFGGMLSFELDVDEATAKKMLSRLKTATMAVSLGGVETLVCFPKDTSHAKMSPAQRQAAGISDTLVRVSVGIENIQDIVEDFEHALSG